MSQSNDSGLNLDHLEALRKIGILIETQDNRITEAPIFVVEQKTPVISDSDYNDCRVEWRETENGDYQLASAERAERLEALHRAGRDTNGWRRYEVTDIWTFVTACFTEQGCIDYLVRNGHNLRETRIYAYGSYRNEEFRSVRNSLIALANQPAPTVPADTLPEQPTDEMLRACGWEDWRPGEYIDRGAATSRYNALRTAALAHQPAQEQAEPRPELTVWVGEMPESNGKTNYTAILKRKGAAPFDTNHMTIARSEYPDRVRYEADCVRFLIGESSVDPCILDYDAEKHSGYVEPARAAQQEPVAAPQQAVVPGARELQPDTKTLQFLTDVVTAAGLLEHGKQSKGLAERISRTAYELRADLFEGSAAPSAPGTPEAPARQPELSVWYGAMPESNGKSNFTAILKRKDAGPFDTCHITIDRSEYPDRVRYEADRVRWLIGEIEEEPFILDYDGEKHSGYGRAAQLDGGQEEGP